MLARVKASRDSELRAIMATCHTYDFLLVDCITVLGVDHAFSRLDDYDDLSD